MQEGKNRCLQQSICFCIHRRGKEMFLIRGVWGHSLLGWKSLVRTRSDMLPPQHLASPCLEPQSGAPPSFVGEEWGCHQPRAYYSSHLETYENTWGHVYLGQAASRCKRGPWRCGWEARVSPYHQRVPLPHPLPALICTLGKEWLESCHVPDRNYPGGLLPGSMKNALRWASAEACTQASCLAALLLLTAPKLVFKDKEVARC